MSNWILVPCLVSLRSEFNDVAPDRSTASDGSVGDTSHSASSSDHNPDETGNTPSEDADSTNEVHALDVTADLRTKITMHMCTEMIVQRHREGLDNRLQNVIYNRRIASRSWGWTWRAYTGTSPHTEHAHFSARYVTDAESSTRTFGLRALFAPPAPAPEEIPVDQAAFNKLMTGWANSPEGRKAIGTAVMDMTISDPAYPTRRVEQVLQDLAALRALEVVGPNAPDAARVPLSAPARKAQAIPTQLDELRTAVTAVRAAVNSLAATSGPPKA